MASTATDEVRQFYLHVPPLAAELSAAVAFGSLGDVNHDVRLLVGLASVVGPLLGLGTAVQLSRHADRSAGVLLVLPALLTPTYFAYVINIPAVIVGGVLAVAAQRLLPESDDSSRHRSVEGLRA